MYLIVRTTRVCDNDVGYRIAIIITIIHFPWHPSSTKLVWSTSGMIHIRIRALNLFLLIWFGQVAAAISPLKMLCCFRRRHLTVVAIFFVVALTSTSRGLVESFSTTSCPQNGSTATCLLAKQKTTDDDDDSFTKPSLVCDRRDFAKATVSAWMATLFSGSRAQAATLTDTTVVPPAPIPLPTTQSNLVPMDYAPATIDLMQFNTANDVPAEYFENQRYIYGFVERVIDGDTIRVRHVPGFGMGASRMPQPLEQRGIANITLSIRIYGVDTPETGKNKRQVSMPFGEDAKQFTTDLVYHKMVKITLLRRDQYNRAVAVVETIPDGVWQTAVGGSKDLSVELAAAGLAELYVGGGAVYYNKRNELEAAIASAKRNKRGIWSLENRQSAAEYKRQQKELTQQTMPTRGGGLVATTAHNNHQALLGEQTRHKAIAKYSNQKHNAGAARRPSSNKENLMDAVVTGLEFLG